MSINMNPKGVTAYQPRASLGDKRFEKTCALKEHRISGGLVNCLWHGLCGAPSVRIQPFARNPARGPEGRDIFSLNLGGFQARRAAIYSAPSAAWGVDGRKPKGPEG